MLLYIHVPFCRRKCKYCAFHSEVPSSDDVARYVDLVAKEATSWGKRLGYPPIKTIFFGGGTPSLLQLPHLDRIFRTIRKAFRVPKDVECTMEANPDSVADWEYLHGIKALGVNRLSLGVQSMDDARLQTLGRPHNVNQVLAAARLIRDAGFANLSLDLIWGLPGQRLHEWLSELRQAVKLKPNHLSCYGLTLEPGTPLEQLSRKVDLEIANEEDLGKMYVYGADFLESEGYLQYEISNFAKMGFQSRHNLGYWEGTPYLGLGPSAVSTINGRRWTNPTDLSKYAEVITSGEPNELEELDRETRISEMVMLRLRTSRGLKLAAYQKLTGESFTAKHQDIIKALRQNDLIRISGGYLRLSRTGMLVSDAILSHFIG